ncbi:striatin-interacting protein 2-like [Hyalella azteca]|uniref:Striatin-interacting protein 2-like n=1 Tax=Hyalella azteca TaxID=294128 RepID=A0A979FM64_HYAAZ|nr:striatin-interacting protein 2-like [Hyalella azteca]
MVKHAMMQLYVLKLLKMQTKYLGRQWRKSNMKTLSAIYQMVRHRLNDDWAYGNDPDARPWDFQTEECSLRAAVDRFNTRRYHHAHTGESEFEPVDNCITSVLGRKVELTEEFTRSYEVWLQREVLNTTIHWDLLLSTNTNAHNSLSSSDTKSRCASCKTEHSNDDAKKNTAAGMERCECKKKLVSEGASGDYTPLIQQLSGQYYRHNEDARSGQAETPEEDEYDKKDKMQTMIKKTNVNGTAASAAVVDISIEDEIPEAESKMSIDEKHE